MLAIVQPGSIAWWLNSKHARGKHASGCLLLFNPMADVSYYPCGTIPWVFQWVLRHAWGGRMVGGIANHSMTCCSQPWYGLL
jgi:hypothetical protein